MLAAWRHGPGTEAHKGVGDNQTLRPTRYPRPISIKVKIMDLFDLNPADNQQLVIRAANAARELSVVRNELTKIHPASDFFKRLDDKIERLKAASDQGTGLATLEIPDTKKIQTLKTALASKAQLASTALSRQNRHLKKSLSKGNLQKPFQTIWSLPGVLRSSHHDRDSDALASAIGQLPALNDKLVRIANSERESLIMRGIVDTRLVSPDVYAIKRLADLVNGYARDLSQLNGAAEKPVDPLCQTRIKQFEKNLESAVSISDFL